jgi:uncharacterized protein
MDTPLGTVEVVDAHVHFFSHRFFEVLAGQSPELRAAPDPVAAIGERTGITLPPRDPAELARQWVAELDAAGVDRALVMASVPGDEGSVAAAVEAHPTRLAGSFMLDPTTDGAGDRARRAFSELGLRMVCLFPAMHRYSLAESNGVRAVVEAASERDGTLVFVHCGVLSVGIRKKLGLPSRFDMRRSNPLEIHPLAMEFPSVPFVIPHFGAGMFREALMLADLCPNVYLDTSSTNGWTRFETPRPSLGDVFERALDVAGPTRLLFGSDSSFFPRGWNRAVFETQVAALARLGVDSEHARAIFGGNLRALLDR